MEDRPGPCEKIRRIDDDFRDLVMNRCPRCRGLGADCAIEYLRALVWEAEYARDSRGRENGSWND